MQLQSEYGMKLYTNSKLDFRIDARLQYAGTNLMKCFPSQVSMLEIRYYTIPYVSHLIVK